MYLISQYIYHALKGIGKALGENMVSDLQGKVDETIEDVKCFTAKGSIIGLLNGGTDDDLSVGLMLSSESWNYSFQNVSEGGTTGYTSEYGASVLCTGSCLSIGVTGECKSGQACWRV